MFLIQWKESRVMKTLADKEGAVIASKFECRIFERNVKQYFMKFLFPKQSQNEKPQIISKLMNYVLVDLKFQLAEPEEINLFYLLLFKHQSH